MLFFLIFVAIGAVTAGVGVSRSRSREGREAARASLREARRDPIGLLPGGAPARVQGRVVPHGAMLTSPISSRSCVAYAVIVHGPYSIVVAQVQAGVRFGVHDASGHALVEVDGTQITLVADHVVSVGTGRPRTPAMTALLERCATPMAAIAGDLAVAPLTFFEAVLAPGTLIDVTGIAAREPDPGAPSETGYRDAASTRLKFASAPTPDPDEK